MSLIAIMWFKKKIGGPEDAAPGQPVPDYFRADQRDCHSA